MAMEDITKVMQVFAQIIKYSSGKKIIDLQSIRTSPKVLRESKGNDFQCNIKLLPTYLLNFMGIRTQPGLS